MMCLNCGNEIKDNEQICNKCGYNKNNSVMKDNAYATINRGIYDPNFANNDEAAKRLEDQKQFDEMLQAYIGNKYLNFRKGKFSWCAFFLSSVYFLYRKMYAIGCIIAILNLLICWVFRNNVILLCITSLIFCLFQGLTFKKLYFNESVERIAKIRHDNKNKGINELVAIARAKGGVNTTIIIPFIVLLLLEVIFIAWLILLYLKLIFNF